MKELFHKLGTRRHKNNNRIQMLNDKLVKTVIKDKQFTAANGERTEHYEYKIRSV
jgi:hypothetical protein